MSQVSRHHAQQEADRLNAFRNQLQDLEREGVIELPPDQRHKLDSYIEGKLAAYRTRFDIDTTSGEKQLSWGLRVASTLGGLSLCAALVLLFQYYWGYLSTPVQVGIVVVAPFAALAATHFAARKEKTLYFAALLSLIAFAAFVTNLVVIGEIFNFTSTHNAFLAWGVFALALAYHYGLRIQLIVGLAAIFSWFSGQVVHMRGYHWFAFGEHPEHFLLTGIAIFLAPFVIRHERHTDFPFVYRFAGMLFCFLSCLALAADGTVSYLPWSNRVVEPLYELTGMLLTAGGVWLGIRQSWVSVVYTSAGFFTLFLYLRLFRWWWDLLPSYVMFAVVGVLALGIMYVLKRLRVLMIGEVT